MQLLCKRESVITHVNVNNGRDLCIILLLSCHYSTCGGNTENIQNKYACFSLSVIHVIFKKKKKVIMTVECDSSIY